MFKLFVIAALVAVAAAAPQPGVIGAPILSTYNTPGVVAASPLAYSAYSAPVAYAGYGQYNGYAASPLAYSYTRAGYANHPYAYASPYVY